MVDVTVGHGQFQLKCKYGSGAFGDIYSGISVKSQEEVAVKLEYLRTRQPQLMYETNVMKQMNGIQGFPVVHWDGVEGEYNVMVMDMLGPSIEDLFTFCGRRFTIKTTCMIADQILRRIEQLHKNCFIHRDIKPDNFLIGAGLAKRFRDIKNGEHIASKDCKALTGTVRYASLNAHLGMEQSRRDDIESIGIMLIYLLKGKLPWQGLGTEGMTQNKFNKLIKQVKKESTLESLAEGLPKEFLTYLTYSRELQFKEEPDYGYLRKQFTSLVAKRGEKYDVYTDWLMKKIGKPIPEEMYAQVSDKW